MKTIINDEKSFNKIFAFCKKYFQNARVVMNKYSHLAKQSQNYFNVILFENRGMTFSIKWNHFHSTLYFGDITINDKACLQYSFTKMKLDNCFPVEVGNNANAMFWDLEIIYRHDDMPEAISPLRIPVELKERSGQ